MQARESGSQPHAAAQAATSANARTLVLYDTGGQWGWNGEIYGQMAANLSSRFGTWDAKPVVNYRAREMSGYSAVIYVGSTYDEPMPVAFLDDVLAGATPTMWLGANIWQLHNRASTDEIPGFFADQYGWQYKGYDDAAVSTVLYKGKTLGRNSTLGGIMDVVITDPSRVEVPALAKRPDGSTFPWAVRAGSLTYIGEVPFTFPTESDRYLIYTDLMFDLLAPSTPERHRAMVRIEDVSPGSDPVKLRALINVLSKRGIPFSMAVIPLWLDPNNDSPGAPKRLTLKDRPEVLAALKYAVANGGTLLAHGYTHQYRRENNPFNGRSGTDYEFFSTSLDADGNAVLEGAVAGDSQKWAGRRMDASLRAFRAAGLPRPAVWEFPHYTASAANYAAVNSRFSARYERTLLFSGNLSGDVDTLRFLDQYFPYEVTDVYGMRVIPENIGHLELDVPADDKVLPRDLVRRAATNLVVRDGFASFFIHNFYGPEMLAETVDGITKLGYTFVSPAQVLRDFPR